MWLSGEVGRHKWQQENSPLTYRTDPLTDQPTAFSGSLGQQETTGPACPNHP